MTAPFTGIVLAGGRSSRMGRDKALLEYGRRTLLDAAVDLLRAAGATAVHVSGDRPSHAGIVDDVSERGPVGGLASVTARCEGGAAIVLPVDMPGLDVATLLALRAALGEARAAHFAGYPLPCALVVDAESREVLQSLVQAGPEGPSVRSMLRALGAAELAAPDPRRLANVNTPIDWAALAS